jgi:hypothetical protein
MGMVQRGQAIATPLVRGDEEYVHDIHLVLDDIWIGSWLNGSTVHFRYVAL